MGEQGLANHAVDEVAQAIGEGVEIGVVDLLYISGEDDFRSFSGASDDRFDFVRREILSLVNNEEDSLQTATSNVSKRRNFQMIFCQKVLNLREPLEVS